jgi:hypothetical protein
MRKILPQTVVVRGHTNSRQRWLADQKCYVLQGERLFFAMFRVNQLYFPNFNENGCKPLSELL